MIGKLFKTSSRFQDNQNEPLGKAFSIAVALHAILILVLVLSWNWQTEAPGPVVIELWTEGTTQQIAKAPDAEEEDSNKEEDPASEPEPDDTPKNEEDDNPHQAQQAPEPTPVPTPPESTQVANSADEQSAAEIALEEARKREREQQELERLAKLEQERLEKERLAKLEQERLEKERLAKLEQERLEKERLAKLEQERLEKERLAKLEKERLEKERLAKLEKEKQEKERQAKLEKEKALRDAFRNDIIGATGIPGGTANQNRDGGGADAAYAGLVRACIRPNVSFPTPRRTGTANPVAEYRVQLKSDGSVTSVSLRRSSGNSSFDRAVENGIRRCSPFPKPPSGKFPNYIDVNYHMYD